MIRSPEDIGFGDPDIDPKQSFNKAITWAKNLNFNTEVYPDDKSDPNHPPRMIFVPEKGLLRKMIKWTA